MSNLLNNYPKCKSKNVESMKIFETIFSVSLIPTFTYSSVTTDNCQLSNRINVVNPNKSLHWNSYKNLLAASVSRFWELKWVSVLTLFKLWSNITLSRWYVVLKFRYEKVTIRKTKTRNTKKYKTQTSLFFVLQILWMISAIFRNLLFYICQYFPPLNFHRNGYTAQSI